MGSPGGVEPRMLYMTSQQLGRPCTFSRKGVWQTTDQKGECQMTKGSRITLRTTDE